MSEDDGQSDVGRCRDHNEDAFLLRPDLGLYLVVDSSGAHGEAARFTVETLERCFVKAAREETTVPYRSSPALRETTLRNAIQLANLRFFERAQREPKLRGMGATLVAVLRQRENCVIVHAGDCRCYLLRDGDLSQLTRDHSLLNEYLEQHRLTPEEIEHFPHKNVVLRALGMEGTILLDSQHRTLQPGDTLLLCSDGLHGTVSNGKMADILRGAPSARAAATQLVAQANENGGHDNITAVVLRN